MERNKIRNTVEYVVDQFSNDPVEGFNKGIVGSNLKTSDHDHQAVLSPPSKYRQIKQGFYRKTNFDKNLTTSLLLNLLSIKRLLELFGS